MRTWLLALSSIVLVAPACGYTVHMDWISTDSDSGSDSSATDATDGPSEPEPLQGVADLHLHMFAENAFGGGWMHGTARGAPEVALAPCDGGDPGDHAWLRDDLAPLARTARSAIASASRLDPHNADGGPIDNRWMLSINRELEPEA